MAEETYLTREDVLKILKINDERLDALVKEGRLQEKEEGKFDEEDIIIYAMEYPPELEEEEMKILPSIEELVAEEEKEEEIELLIPYEETAVEEKEVLPPIEEPVAEEEKEEEIELLTPYEETAVEKKEVLPPIEEPVPAVDEGLRIEPIESEDEAKAEPEVEPGVEPEREELVLFGPRELAPRKSPFFIFLSLLSLVIILASIGILVLPVLDIAIPEFIKPVVDFVSGLF
ncbi:MAG: hypothetical protein DDT31_00168 [Syntrophomonadaceae bacterium]|nr:hypothetical protein [Bacillota bacterium]